MRVPYEDLDPGIRNTVKWLTGLGFTTCDSGDGVSKFVEGNEMECAMPFPHVAISCKPGELEQACIRLLAELRAVGVDVQPQGPEEHTPGVVHIQGSYDPTMEECHRSHILVIGLCDMLL